MIFKGLTLQGIYGRQMYETWYKMTQMVLTGFPLQKVLTHQIAIDDFQQGFDLMDAGRMRQGGVQLELMTRVSACGPWVRRHEASENRMRIALSNPPNRIA